MLNIVLTKGLWPTCISNTTCEQHDISIVLSPQWISYIPHSCRTCLHYQATNTSWQLLSLWPHVAWYQNANALSNVWWAITACGVPTLPVFSPFNHLGHISLIWINLNPNVDKKSHVQSSMICYFFYLFPNFKGTTAEVWKWISYLILYFIVNVITNPCWGWS